MATNTRHRPDDATCTHDPRMLGDRTCSDDPLACHVAEALAHADDPAARYHLREALQYRLTEEL